MSSSSSWPLLWGSCFVNLLGPDLLAQVVVSIRQDGTYTVNDSIPANVSRDDAEKILTAVVGALRSLGEKCRVHVFLER